MEEGTLTATQITEGYFLYYEGNPRGIRLESANSLYNAYEVQIDTLRNGVKVWNAQGGEWVEVTLSSEFGQITDSAINLAVGVYDFSYNLESGVVKVTESYAISIKEGYYLKGINGLGIGRYMDKGAVEGEYVVENFVSGSTKEGIYLYHKGATENAIYDFDDLEAPIGVSGTYGKIVLPQGIYNVVFNANTGKVTITSTSTDVVSEVLIMVMEDMMRNLIHLPYADLDDGVIDISNYRQLALMYAYGWLNFNLLNEFYIPSSLATGTKEDNFYGTFTKAEDAEIYAPTTETYNLTISSPIQEVLVQQGA